MSVAAKVYAKALFELGREKGQLEAFQKDLRDFAEACGSHPSLLAVLSSAGINPNSRAAVLDGVLAAAGLGPVIGRLLELLAARGRVAEIADIVKELDLLVEQARGVRPGEVRSAVELSAEELSVLANALAKRVGGKVRLTQVVDPTLLGGVVASVGGRTFDASLRSQLERFKNELI